MFMRKHDGAAFVQGPDASVRVAGGTEVLRQNQEGNHIRSSQSARTSGRPASTG
jgi:hypothetical protein